MHLLSTIAQNDRNYVRSSTNLLKGYSKFLTKESTEDKALKLIQSLNFAKSLIRIHGLTNFKIKYASCEASGHALSNQTKDESNILIGLHVQDIVPSEHYVQVLAGLALHEAGHLQHSDWLFKWASLNRYKVEVNFKEGFNIRNIIEDCRMEDIVVKQSAGFKKYIGSARKYLFANSVDNWKKTLEKYELGEVSPRSVCLAIIFMYFRCPNSLTPSLIDYQYNGVSPFDYLSAYTGNLETANDAEELACYVQALVNLFSGKDMNANGGKPSINLQDKVEENKKNGGGGQGSSIGKPDTESDTYPPSTRDPNQFINEHDYTKIKSERTLEDAIEARKNRVEHEQSQQGGNTLESDDSSRSDKNAKTRQKNAQKLQEHVDDARKQRSETTFDFTDMDEIQRDYGKSSKHLQLAKAIQRCEDENVETHTDVGVRKGQKVVTRCPRATVSKEEDTYGYIQKRNETVAEIKTEAKKIANKLAKTLQVRLAEIERRQYGLREGKLSRRHLSTAMVTGKPFYNKQVEKATGMSFCMILDESASMGRLYKGSRSYQTMLSSYAIYYAMKKIPRVDLFVYSHTTFGDNEKDCIIQKLVHPVDNKTGGLNGYTAKNRGCNYDSVALKVCGEDFLKSSLYENKTLLMISDGLPNGYQYGGDPACQLVKNEVKSLTKKGLNVMQLGIGNEVKPGMFKQFIQLGSDTIAKDISKLFKKFILKGA